MSDLSLTDASELNLKYSVQRDEKRERGRKREKWSKEISFPLR